MKGSEAIVRTLIENGTDVTFGFPGGQVIPLFDEFLNFEDKIKNIIQQSNKTIKEADKKTMSYLG